MALTRRELLLTLPGLAVARRAFAQPQAAPLQILGLHQVTLAVSDVARSLYFYQSLFGMPIQVRRGTTMVLRIGEGPQFLALSRAGAGEPRISHWGMSVEGFDPRQVVSDLGGFGVTCSFAAGEAVAAMLEDRPVPWLDLAACAPARQFPFDDLPSAAEALPWEEAS